jgi:hypothetical protein
MMLGALALLCVSGCQNDAIQHYQVPKPPVYRMLGAIVPHGPNFWFFKLTGPDEEILERKPEFDRFLDSVTFTGDDKPPSWKLPAGWRQEEGDAMRVATLLLGPQDRPLELSISRFGRNTEEKAETALLANVNRWRGQMGLSRIEADRLAEIARPRDVHGVTFYVLDMIGPKPGKTSRGMAMPPGPAPAERPEPAEGEPEKSALRYTTPAGWRELGKKGPLGLPEFQAGEGGEMAKVTVLPFPKSGAMGDVAANVNRWRGQVELPPLDEERARREATAIEVDGAHGSFVDLGSPSGRTRLLAVMVSRGNQIWFFKMMGPDRVVARQKTAFEAFVKSVRFE